MLHKRFIKKEINMIHLIKRLASNRTRDFGYKNES